MTMDGDVPAAGPADAPCVAVNPADAPIPMGERVRAIVAVLNVAIAGKGRNDPDHRRMIRIIFMPVKWAYPRRKQKELEFHLAQPRFIVYIPSQVPFSMDIIRLVVGVSE